MRFDGVTDTTLDTVRGLTQYGSALTTAVGAGEIDGRQPANSAKREVGALPQREYGRAAGSPRHTSVGSSGKGEET